MKQILLGIFSLLCMNALFAQSITFDPDLLAVSGTTEDFNIDGKFTTTNSTMDEVAFLWELERVDVPDEWKFTICDANLCYAPGVETCPSSQPNIFPAGFSTGATKVTVQPNGVMYDGMVIFRVVDAQNNANEIGSLEISFSVTGSTSTFDADEDKVNIYPNPTSDYFQLDASGDISRVVLYNIIGKEVKSYSFANSKNYDVRDLQTGMYLVRLFDQTGKANQVLRLTVK